MYVGTVSLRSVGHYFAGYCAAIEDSGIPADEFRGFIIWLSERFLISHSAWHWTRILIHTYGSDAAAIKALPDLFVEYTRTKEGKSLSELEADRDTALRSAFGRLWHEPDETHSAV